MSKHTPIPWRQLASTTTIIGPDSVTTARVVERTGADETQANADFIIRAVNSHDALLAACEAVVEQGMGEGQPPDDPIVVIQLTREEWNALRAAIAAAKGDAR